VLAEKNDPDLRHIPSPSHLLRFRAGRAAELQGHANCYVKPIDLHRFLEVVQAVESFWLQIVRLPSRDR
jgi:hypothetical protein